MNTGWPAPAEPGPPVISGLQRSKEEEEVSRRRHRCLRAQEPLEPGWRRRIRDNPGSAVFVSAGRPVCMAGRGMVQHSLESLDPSDSFKEVLNHARPA
eukprot:gene17625-biopygen12897